MEGDPWPLCRRLLRCAISIHALRVEGDRKKRRSFLFAFDFYPRPPGGGRRRDLSLRCRSRRISIHALRVEGDIPISTAIVFLRQFLSTPSGWRATAARGAIHAPAQHFYPRPPGGGRPKRSRRGWPDLTFLSTPSGWRATVFDGVAYELEIFLSTPSGWRATGRAGAGGHHYGHFYPRPPGGGRLLRQSAAEKRWKPYFYPRPPGGGRQAKLCSICVCLDISIHALRVEGDEKLRVAQAITDAFLSTPSGWRATAQGFCFPPKPPNFYPRPPGGGRL